MSDAPKPPVAPDSVSPPDFAAGTPEEIASRLQGSSIEEVLRIQDQLAKLVRERYERPLAVMFSDIAGSTAYFEKYGDAEGRRWIQRHNDLLIPVIQKRGGRVVKTIGDALMVTFPSANVAVGAAIAMQQATHEANARVSHDEERFEIRIGVNCGTALVNDKDGDVYGDMVNVAARVQSEADKGQIFVSDAVREQLSPTTPLKPAGMFQLKGKSQEFALHQVLWREARRHESELEKPNLGTRYAVLDMLGSGGMATVWRARDEKLGRDVAVKVLHGHMQVSWATRERFQREAVVAASLAHDNIVQVYDYATQEAPQSFIAMELVEGEQLRRFMERSGALPSLGALLVANEIARGLSFAHARQVIHRDLKPENVLVSRSGGVKIADFGIAGIGEAVRLTQPGAQLGTPAYLAPEQLRGEPASTRSDVFALGVMLYEMSTGRAPFLADTSAATMYRIVEGSYVPPEQVASVDVDLAAIIRRCLLPDPAQRYASAAEVSSELAGTLQRRGVFDPRVALSRFFTEGTLPSPHPPVPLQQPRARGRSLLPVAIAGGLLVCGAVAAAALLSRPPSTPVHDALPPLAVTLPPKEVIAEVAAPPALPPPEVPARAPDAVTAIPARVITSKKAKRATAVPERPVATPEEKVSAVGERKVSEYGTLKLSVSGGWADIKIDGVKMGRYPTQRSFTLPEGGHVLELTGNEARAPYRQRILIEAGKTLEQKAELQPISP